MNKSIIVKNIYNDNLAVYGHTIEKKQDYKTSTFKDVKSYYDLKENILYEHINKKFNNEIQSENNTSSDKVVKTYFKLSEISKLEQVLLTIFSKLIITYYNSASVSLKNSNINKLYYKKFEIKSKKQNIFIENILKEAYLFYYKNNMPILLRGNNKIFILPNKKIIINTGYIKNLYWILNILNY